jgi:hypothetical protein
MRKVKSLCEIFRQVKVYIILVNSHQIGGIQRNRQLESTIEVEFIRRMEK